MATNPLIKKAFGNHYMIRQYMDYLNNPKALPPFFPVLYRSVAYGENNIDIIIANERSRHEAINRKVKCELITQFKIYRQLKNGE